MAILDNKGRLRGTLGPNVFRLYGDKNVVQSKPARIKQTVPTKARAAEFGIASATSRIIRENFFQVIQERYDRGMARRLTTLIRRAISANRELECGKRDLYTGDFGLLKDFQFNTGSPVYDILYVRPKTYINEQGIIEVSIPAFSVYDDLKRPHNWGGCTLRSMAVAFNFQREDYEDLDYYDLDIERGQRYTDPVQWLFNAPLPPGYLILVCFSLHFYRDVNIAGRMDLNSRALNPAELTGIFKSDELLQLQTENKPAGTSE